MTDNIYQLLRAITPLDEDFSVCGECWAEFWVHSDNFDSDQIYEKLLSPGLYKSKLPKKRRGPQRFKGVFAIASDIAVSSKDLRYHLNWICDLMESFKGMADLQQDDKTCASIIYYYYPNEDVAVAILSPEQLNRLAGFNIEITIKYINDLDEQDSDPNSDA